MGDFASPAAGANGSICINNSLNNSVVAPGPVVGIPKHSTVVERLRQRIEGCRRHHVTCETRYQQAHAEQLEIERRETVSLYQRSLEQRAKKSAPGSTKQPQSKQLEADSAVSTEQRNNTLIAVGASHFVHACKHSPHASYTPTLHVPQIVRQLQFSAACAHCENLLKTH
ncbi:hypothetical protein NL108_007425 [Boleophthalmus pectinirostris]|nr:hypothetical protein NL108_007425 [Boleophthalmus pectinirostris]